MAFELSPDATMLSDDLSGIDLDRMQVVWIRQPEDGLKPGHIQAIERVLHPLRCIVWRVDGEKMGTPPDTEPMSSVVQNRRILTKSSVLIRPWSIWLETSVRWLHCDEHEWLAGKFTSHSGKRSAIAGFVKDDVAIGVLWARVTAGFEWGWQSERIRGREQQALVYRILESYVSLTVLLGGIAVLEWIDMREVPGLALIGIIPPRIWTGA
jgi:hypothetical protein